MFYSSIILDLWDICNGGNLSEFTLLFNTKGSKGSAGLLVTGEFFSV